MIHNVDAALRELIEGSLDAVQAEFGVVQLQLDAPTKDWASRQNQPTVDAYLYDIRRDLGRNEVGIAELRDDAGDVTERRPTPTWFRLSYLVTAWTQRPEDEHRLLAHLMGAFLGHESLQVTSDDDEVLHLPIGVAMPPPQDRALSDVWSALGGELKPSLDIVVVTPIEPSHRRFVGPPVEVEPVFVAVDDEGGEIERFGGRDLDAPPLEHAIWTRRFRFDPKNRR